MVILGGVDVSDEKGTPVLAALSFISSDLCTPQKRPGLHGRKIKRASLGSYCSLCLGSWGGPRGAGVFL